MRGPLLQPERWAQGHTAPCLYVGSTTSGGTQRPPAPLVQVIVDAELRSRSAQLLSDAARKAGAGVARGLQHGAGRIAAGPRSVQGVLQRLQARIEEQRLRALLEEQRDTPVDVQVGAGGRCCWQHQQRPLGCRH